MLTSVDYVILGALVAVVSAIAIGVGTEIAGIDSAATKYPSSEQPHPASIAVLAFENMTSDPENEYLAEGISEELLNSLARIRGFRVSARTSSFSFKGKEIDATEIAGQLGVANVLEGSVRMSGDRVRITAQLIDGKDGMHRWSETYDRRIQDILQIQDDIASNIVAALGETLEVEEVSTASKGLTDNAEAYRHFLRGRSLMATGVMSHSDADLLASISAFEAAISVDHGFGNAYAALSDAYETLAYLYEVFHKYDAAREARSSAVRAGREATAIAPGSSEAWRVHGILAENKTEKEDALRKSLAINPSNARAWQELALLLVDADITESISAARRAHQLDPFNAGTIGVLAQVLTAGGHLRESSELMRLAWEMANGPNAEVPPPGEQYRNWKSSLLLFPQNLDFEMGIEFWAVDGQCEEGFDLRPHSSELSDATRAIFSSSGLENEWCNVSQALQADRYKGKFVRLTGELRVDGSPDSAFLWIRANNYVDVINFSSNESTPIAADMTEWTKRDIALFVPEDADFLTFGVVLKGSGALWLDSFRFEAFDDENLTQLAF